MSLKFPSFIFKRIYIHLPLLLLLNLKKNKNKKNILKGSISVNLTIVCLQPTKIQQLTFSRHIAVFAVEEYVTENGKPTRPWTDTLYFMF